MSVYSKKDNIGHHRNVRTNSAKTSLLLRSRGSKEGGQYKRLKIVKSAESSNGGRGGGCTLSCFKLERLESLYY